MGKDIGMLVKVIQTSVTDIVKAKGELINHNVTVQAKKRSSHSTRTEWGKGIRAEARYKVTDGARLQVPRSLPGCECLPLSAVL
ncbi:hypothetical protein AGOR_G00219880 [Albula goreensis]|uniref:Uncharacterized protein n=1 Tax=Albula goreensis TaxID=1534307 RepID=A0A8T3CN65_9TELE|nr:hypothetical protein AGOR_G00219880 [Albula goreensis]